MQFILIHTCIQGHYGSQLYLPVFLANFVPLNRIWVLLRNRHCRPPSTRYNFCTCISCAHGFRPRSPRCHNKFKVVR